MTRAYKIGFSIALTIAIIYIGTVLYDRHLLQQEYLKTLKHNEDEIINLFYKSSFNGTITYIRQYEKNPNNYVVSLRDSANNEITIGKVEITNFSHVLEGDSIRKVPNTFELEINGSKKKTLSQIKYK